ncbi:MAG: TolC family outer membrane protein [Spongiibacteraceae bacterium]|nr:TolC family outer membrane protein [Spongiibacteraceae bacterium]MBN4055652.1 TolC family outer membrane protein [bacterium AH-315-K03]
MKLLFNPLFLAVIFITSSAMSTADTLSDIYELALKNDATLKQAEATYRANIETKKQALSAILPQIEAEGSYQKFDQESNGFTLDTSPNPSSLYVDSTSDKNTDTEVYSLSLTQQLFNLPAWFTFKSGKQTSKQAKAQLAFDQQDLIVRVAVAYFNVLRAQDNLEASKAEERATQRQLEQTQQRFDVGLIAITEVHEARAVFDTTVVQRLTDEGNLGTSFESLAVLTGQAPTNLWLLSNDFPISDPDPIARNEWVQFALKNNYSLKAALHAMEAARQQATAKKMEHLPKVSGTFSYGDNSTTGSVFSTPSTSFNSVPPDSDSETEQFLIRLTMPIYSGGRISSQRRQAYEQYNIALQQKINTQRQVVQNTRASHITVATDVQRVKARAQAIVSTNSALEATQAGYEVGTRNIVDVLNAQRRLFSAIRDYSNSRYDYVINMLNLKQASGILSPQDVYDIDKWMVEAGSPTANKYQQYLNR